MDAQLRRYYVAAAGITLVASAVSLAWGDPRVTTGVAAGAAVSVVPFASWHMVVALGMGQKAGQRALVVGLVLAKYALLAALMWFLFRFHLANQYGFGAGLIAGSLAVLGAVTGGIRKD